MKRIDEFFLPRQKQNTAMSSRPNTVESMEQGQGARCITTNMPKNSNAVQSTEQNENCITDNEPQSQSSNAVETTKRMEGCLTPTTGTGTVESAQPLTKRIRTEPLQPSNIGTFSKNERKFLPAWYKEFTWVEYDAEKGAAFCHPCRQVAIQGGSVAKEGAFVTDGFQRWKKATECFSKHEASMGHRISLGKFEAMKSGTNVLAQLNEQHEEERKLAGRCLHKIFTTVRAIARQGLPLRGHSATDSNFYHILQLRTEDSDEMKKWMMRKTNWTSWAVQDEILKDLSDAILRDIIEDIKKRQVYCLMVDETADISGIEQMSVCFRTVTDSLEVEETFVGFYSLDRCDAASIFAAINDVLLRFDLSLNNCRGQTYDGAASFQGSLSGVVRRISEVEPRALDTHCYMHSVNLAVQDVVATVPFMRDFLQLIQELTSFMRDSPKRNAIVKLVAEEVHCSQTHIRPLCPTRFTVKFQTLDGIYKQLAVIPKALAIIEGEASSTKAASQASGLQRRLDDFDFYLALVVSRHLFEITDRLSKALQAKTMSAGCGVTIVQAAVLELSNFRSDTKFDLMYEEALTLASDNNANSPKLPRQARAPRRFQTADNHQHDSPKSYFRMRYFEIFDVAITKLQERITNKASPILRAIERVTLSGWNGDDILDDDLDTICTFYGKDLEKFRLKNQLLTLENMREDEAGMSLEEIVAAIGNSGMKKMVPQVVKLLQLYLVCAATTATAERSFSQLRRLKSYLRSTIQQSRLNHLAVLSAHKERIDSLDIAAQVKAFIQKNGIRRKAFHVS